MRHTAPGKKTGGPGCYIKSLQYITILKVSIQNLQKPLSAAQRSEEQLSGQANLPTHSTQAGARPREGRCLVLRHYGSKSVHAYKAENLFIWTKRTMTYH